ncbi:hypothetical protein CDAR_46971 [Caerostris darwini]|uniref:Uncharacterized protein n=1 Tax=Caerostris darwini TaxID=1538125 RepID=A0AAV4T285_9ARAC|nr:hypothetical protein CDAR_46971 [Caerostris darwini]
MASRPLRNISSENSRRQSSNRPSLFATHLKLSVMLKAFLNLTIPPSTTKGHLPSTSNPKATVKRQAATQWDNNARNTREQDHFLPPKPLMPSPMSQQTASHNDNMDCAATIE